MSDALFRAIGVTGSEHTRKVNRDLDAAEAIYESLFAQQRRVVDDPHPYKACLCPRRSGKSHVGAGSGVRKCLLTPGARVLIVGLTVNSVKRAFWRAIEGLVRAYGLEGEFNRTDLSFSLWNGSYLFLYGAETIDRIERLRGDEFDLVIVDEAKSFSPYTLAYLINEVLMPAVATRNGEIWMVGTPGHIFDGEFYLATNPGKRDKEGRLYGRWFSDDAGVLTDVMWSVHRWTMADNVAKPDQWQRVLDDKARRGWRDDHPAWRREYLGEWVVNEDGLVYALGALLLTDPERVTWVKDPNRPGSYGLPDGDWHFLLGIDFGFENPTAFVVAAYSREPQELRILHSEKHQHMVLSEVAQKYVELVRRYGGFEAVVVDAGAQGKMIHETLLSDYGIPAIPAEKREKQAYIQAMNSDFHSGRIKVLVGDDYTEEASQLSWDLGDGGKEELARKGRLKEDSAMPNDLCDAGLYIWRWSAHRWEDERLGMGAEPGTRQWWLDRETQAKETSFEARRREREEDDLVRADEPFTHAEVFGVGGLSGGYRAGRDRLLY